MTDEADLKDEIADEFLTEEEIKERGIEEFRDVAEYYQEMLDMPWPEFWRTLAEHAPEVMRGYYEMREFAFDYPPEGAIPAKYKELLCVVCGCGVHNRWGIKAHTRAAVREGATVEEVAEAIAIAIVNYGMPNYRNFGYHAIKAAEEAAEEYDRE